MSRYIDAEKIKYSYLPLAVMPDVFVTKKEIDKMPSEDVAPVIHAHWDWDGDCICSSCGKDMEYEANYCPRCGAKMDEETGK